MQKDPSSSGLPSNVLDAAFARARADLRAAVDHAVDASPLGDDPAAGDDHGERLLGANELLHVVREPVEWLLSLAHRLASRDIDDVAAIDRLRLAFHGRLAGRPIGVRMNDALTAFGLLVGALDPRVVLASVTKSIADGVATILTYEGATFAAQLCELAETFPGLVVERPGVERQRPSRSARPNHTR
jgi:hypothetical protein